MEEGYAYVWEYRVKPDADQQFREYYGPQGRWVQLFRQATGYLGTSLYQDREQTDRYVTVDRWESEGAFGSFRAQFSVEFERLDNFCESLTLSEAPLGNFTTIGE